MAIQPANPARGVQSLGRRDVGAPIAAANAIASAARYEGAGLMAIGAAAGDVQKLIQERLDQRAVEELNEQWLLAQAEAQRAMTAISSPTMPADTPGLEGIDYQRTLAVAGPGGVERVERTDIPTYEVGGEWFATRMQTIREAAEENLSDSRSRKKFAAQWALKEAELQAKVVGHLREQRNADLRGSYQRQVDQYLQLADEGGAKALARQAFAMRVMNGEQLAQELQRIEQRVDLQYYTERLAASDSQAQLEALIQEAEAGEVLDAETGAVRRARSTPEQLWQVRQQANAKLGQLDQARSRRHDEGRREAVVRLADGNLSRAWIRSAVASDQLDPGVGASLLESLRVAANRAPVSTPGVVDAYARRINSIWVVGEGETVSANASRLRAELTMAAHGIDPATGKPTPNAPRLTGEDFGKLMSQLDTVSGRFDNDPRYQDAVKAIESASGVPPAGSFWDPSPGNLASMRARNAGILAMRDYIDSAGLNADPRAWAQQNADAFKAENWTAKTVREFSESPNYALVAPFVPEPKGGTLTREAVIDGIGSAMAHGVIPPEVARAMHDQVHGLDMPATPVAPPEAMPSPLPADDLPWWNPRGWFGDDDQPSGVRRVEPGAQGARP